ncbi:MAG: hypothetical protein ABSH28_00815, partial [Acidobacteriota bacterium]
IGGAEELGSEGGTLNWGSFALLRVARVPMPPCILWLRPRRAADFVAPQKLCPAHFVSPKLPGLVGRMKVHE